MERLQPLEEIFNSWRRCISLGLANSIATVNTYAKEDTFQAALFKNKRVVSLFEDLGTDLEDIAANSNSVFLLVNSDGILLKKSVAGN